MQRHSAVGPASVLRHDFPIPIALIPLCHRLEGICAQGPAGMRPGPTMRRRVQLLFASLALIFLCVPALSQQSSQPPAQAPDLTTINIEDLMNIKVTSVSRTEEKLSRTA